MNDVTAPCRGCPDRIIGCHGQDANGLYKCERYGIFKAHADAERERRREFLRENDKLADIHKRRQKK